ncbi:MAG TPA: tetratricopeptide repeat protein [Candidatus Sulfopaludibacter sp.]|jgi:Tfp pilus assembly protein PilF|nr:tetratricopeptide repeat protein [Candidatus Sulfopaludibacter sp.]
MKAKTGRDRRVAAICILLGLASFLVYFQTLHYDFVAYDDDYFVYQNPVIQAGLRASGVVWSFGLHYANWHPLTWISYLLDVQLFGTTPGGFHATNVLLHAGSAVLLFLALLRMTGRMWRCAAIAAVFALHPLHVESVAWISERKDVLSTFVEMAALLLYVRYAERATLKRYLWMLLAFVLSLMAKPMAVTFPVILLLLDYWPLRRRAFAEKVPLFAASLAASILTVLAQQAYGTVATLESIPLSTRIANAAVAYVVYLKQTFWPANLAVLYPTTAPAPGAGTMAVLLLAAITAVVVLQIRRRPYLFTGWFWYLGMLVPVIGLVQVGAQSRADRYMYLPLVGLALAIVWLAADFVERHPVMVRPGAALTCAVLLVFAAVSWQQTKYWKDSRTLFEHAIAITDRNFIMRNNLGVVLSRAGDLRGAMFQYAQAIAINPDYAEAQANFGNALLRAGMPDAARPMLEKAVQLKPDFPMAQLDFGIVQVSAGNYREAIAHLSEALRLTPEDPEVHSNLCYALEHVGRLDEAAVQCREALRLRPDYPDAQFNLRNVLAAQSRPGSSAHESRQ